MAGLFDDDIAPKPVAPGSLFDVEPGPSILNPVAVSEGLAKNPDEEVRKERGDGGAAPSDPRIQELDENTRSAPVTRESINNPNILSKANDSLEEMSAFEVFTSGFKQGNLQTKADRLAAEDLYGDGLNDDERANLRQMDIDLAAMGRPDDQFSRILGGTGETLGQLYETIFDTQTAVNVGVGAAAGLAAGPVGVAGGVGVGIATTFAATSFMSASTSIYREAIQAGVDPEIAKLSALVGGGISGSIDAASAGIGTALVGNLKKEAVQGLVKRAMTHPKVVAAMTGAIGRGAGALATEAGTEALQEAIAIGAVETAKKYDGKDIDPITVDQAFERVVEAARAGLEGSVGLVAAGTGVNKIREKYQQKKLENQNKTLQDAAKQMQDSPVMARAPEVAQEHMTKVLEENVSVEYHIGSEGIAEYLEQNPEAQEVLGDRAARALELGEDVTLNSEEMAKVMSHPAFSTLEGHIRTDIGLTGVQQKELDELTDEDAELDPAVDQLGARAMFQTAEESGFTPKQMVEYNQQNANIKADRERQREIRKLTKEKAKLAPEVQAEEQKLRAQAEETVNQSPVYNAMNSLQSVRLSKEATQALLAEQGMTLDDLPTQARGRKLYGGKLSINPDVVADMYGFANGMDMLRQMVLADPRDVAIQKQVDEGLKAQYPQAFADLDTLNGQIRDLIEADVGRQIGLELNALRKLAGQKLISRNLAKDSAKVNLSKTQISDIKPEKFLAKAGLFGKRAGKLLKGGDPGGAARAKFQQQVAVESAKQAFSLQSRLEKDRAFLNKQAKKLPSRDTEIDALTDALLKRVSFKKGFTSKKATEGAEHIRRRHRNPLDIEVPPNTPWKSLTEGEMRALVNSVKKLKHQADMSDKYLNAERKRKTTETVAALNDQLTKFKSKDIKPATTLWERRKENLKDLASITMNMDAIAAILDKGERLGPFYRAIKEPIDKAISGGYLEGTVGLQQRKLDTDKKFNDLMTKHFTEQERVKFGKHTNIAGRAFTENQRLSVLLNSANQQNIDAMIETGTITQSQYDAIIDGASDRDKAYIKDVWNLLDSYWPEIEAAKLRREGVRPEKVEGNYYPIRYERDLLSETAKDPEEAIMLMRTGGFTASHTRDGHTQKRKGSSGQKVALDMFTIRSHLAQVNYDLEMGDAVNDVYKVITDKDFKAQLSDKGMDFMYEAMHLWMRDMVTGDLSANSIWEQSFRLARRGTIAMSLGLNLSVAAQQLTGLVQSNTLVGPKYMGIGIGSFARNPARAIRETAKKSAFMRNRAINQNVETQKAEAQIRKNALDKSIQFVPGLLGKDASPKIAAYLRETPFFLTRTFQSVVDNITWRGAYAKALAAGLSDKDAVLDADRTVRRTQGTADNADRSAIERGTTSETSHQKEATKAMNLFITYFAAKQNLLVEGAYNRTKLELIRQAAALYMVEGILAGGASALTYSLAYNDDEKLDEIEEDPWMWGAKQTMMTAVAGIPFVRDVGSLLGGFTPRAPSASVLTPVVSLGKEIYKAEDTSDIAKEALKVAGAFGRVPSNEIIRLIEQGED